MPGVAAGDTPQREGEADLVEWLAQAHTGLGRALVETGDAPGDGVSWRRDGRFVITWGS